MRSRHSGIWSAICANDWTSFAYCFSPTSRPAATISEVSSFERGVNPCGSGFGMTTISGAASPSCSRSQSAVVGVSSATTSARGAWASSGSSPAVRSDEDRCSWWTTTGSLGSSWIAQASRPGVTVTTTSASKRGRNASIATSQSALNCASQRFGTSSDSRWWSWAATSAGTRSVATGCGCSPSRTETR